MGETADQDAARAGGRGTMKAQGERGEGRNGSEAGYEPVVDGEHHDGHESAEAADDELELDAPGAGRAAMLAQLRILRQHRRRAERRGDDSGWMRLVDLERKALVEFARLNGELTPTDEARLTSSARWQAIRAAIANALALHPQAAEAVERALAEIDA